MTGDVCEGELRPKPAFNRVPGLGAIAQPSPLMAVTRGADCGPNTLPQLLAASRGSQQTSMCLIVVTDTSVLWPADDIKRVQ